MRRRWAATLAGAVILAGLAGAGTANAVTYDILVRIAPDSATGQVRTQNGYTVSIINTTAQDLAFDQVRFLMPGHGSHPLDEDVYGEPKQSRDTTSGFTYVPGSTTGLTTSDPTQFERWLTWGGGTVAAGSTATLHFHITLSDFPGSFWAGATVDAPNASVQGTAKGADIRVVGSDQFALTLEASPTVVRVGDTITYTGTVINNTDKTLTVKEFRLGGCSFGTYIPGSTTGVLTTEPIPSRKGYIWRQLFEVPRHSQVQFSLGLRAEVVGSGKRVQSRVTLTEPLPDGQIYAGTGPTAPVRIVE